ncbi:B30.2/SPRY domain-containing protein [Entamoeba marina]
MSSQQEVELLKKEIKELKNQLMHQSMINRQILWFGDYSFYSDKLIYDKTSLTIGTPSDVSASYYSVILYVHIRQFSIRVLKGDACFGFISMTGPINLDGRLPQNQAHMLYYDGVYYASGKCKERSSFGMKDGVLSARYDEVNGTIYFGCNGKEDEAFRQIDESNLCAIISLRKDSTVQVL